MNLPSSWVLSPIGEIAEINPTLDKSVIADDLRVSFVPMPGVEAESGRIDVSASRPFAEVKKGYTPFQEGDVLFAKITPCMENGKMAIVPKVQGKLGFGSTEFHVLRPPEGISAEYLYHFVSSKRFRIDAEHNMTGAVGQRRVPAPYLAKESLPIPPSAEQRRIVAKIEELFSELDKGIETLKTAKAQLAVYRQAILKDAFEGKLTAEWRSKHADKLENAEQLLFRIRDEREATYNQQIVEWKAALDLWAKISGSANKPSKPTKPKPQPPITEELLKIRSLLPDQWTYVRLGEVIEDPVYGTSKKCSYDAIGTGVLRIPNVVAGLIDSTDLKFAEFSPEERESYALKTGDLLMIRSNGSISIVGRCAQIKESNTDLLYAGYLIRLRPHSGSAESTFLQDQLHSHALRLQIERAAKSTSGVNNINSGEICSLIIAICSVEEQRVVAAILGAKLSSIDALESDIETNLQKAEALRQSILKKAFAGELVPQDPSDEPASVLLERIRAERAEKTPRAASIKPKTRGRKPRAATI